MSTHTESEHAEINLTPLKGGKIADHAVNRTLCLEQAELALLKLKHYTALVVWRSMLREARRKQSWQICQKVEALIEDTCLSESTILRAQKVLVKLGYATILSGGCGSRKTITFGLTPITGIVFKPPQIGHFVFPSQ